MTTRATSTGDLVILLPKSFFISSGCADSPVSDLNAFDLALLRAGISEQNLVAVSSVLPIGAKEVGYTELEMGAVTHCVLSQMRGTEGEVISAGIAIAYRMDGKGGYVAEGHLHGSADSLDDELRAKMAEMARIRGIEITVVKTCIESMKVPPGRYGCCVAALVFTEYE